MPFTWNGCGTRFYGQRDATEDGSYITTLWLSLVWVPVLPLASYRIRPTGEGFNVLVYRSDSYTSYRVPLCWKQVRNVYLVASPIIAGVLFLNLADAKGWFKSESHLGNARAQYQAAAALPAAPSEAPLGKQDAKNTCGSVLQLDTDAFPKLGIHTRLSSMISDAGFTDEELSEEESAKDLEQDLFHPYSLGYTTWEDSNSEIRAKLAKGIEDEFRTESLKLKSEDRPAFYAYEGKYDRLILTAFDMGRRDARTSPCPY